MTSPFQKLAGIRDACATLPGLATCRIGFETPILPRSYPLLRLVLSVTREQQQGNPWDPLMEIVVYYGENVRPLDEGGLEAQHAWLMDMEDKIKHAIIPGDGTWRAQWVETAWDEDRIPGLKLFASRFEVW